MIAVPTEDQIGERFSADQDGVHHARILMLRRARLRLPPRRAAIIARPRVRGRGLSSNRRSRAAGFRRQQQVATARLHPASRDSIVWTASRILKTTYNLGKYLCFPDCTRLYTPPVRPPVPVRRSDSIVRALASTGRASIAGGSAARGRPGTGELGGHVFQARDFDRSEICYRGVGIGRSGPGVADGHH